MTRVLSMKGAEVNPTALPLGLIRGHGEDLTSQPYTLLL